MSGTVRLIEEYLSSLKGVRSQRTIEFKSQALFYLEKPRDLDRKALFELYAQMREKISHSTAIAYLMEIRKFYKYLSENGYSFTFDHNAFKEILRKKEDTKKARKYFTEQEVKAILDYIRNRPFLPIYYVFSVFLLSSGLRLSEALALRKRDISQRFFTDEFGNQKRVWIVKVKGKYSKEREVPLYFFFPEHEKVIEEHISQLRADTPLFLYQIQYPKSVKTLTLSRDAVFRVYQKVEKALGFPVNAHRFRFTYATWLATKGVPLNLIKELLGHSTIKTTMEVYAQAQREKLIGVLFADC